ncbi:MAG: hypothetical protein ABI743_03475, partial [bacterium]
MGLLTVAAARSLPTLASEMLRVREAMRLRHIRVRDIGLLGWARPVLAAAFRRAGTLAASLQVRGIDPAAPKLGPIPRMQRGERLILML